jgi:hypothetical protein
MNDLQTKTTPSFSSFRARAVHRDRGQRDACRTAFCVAPTTPPQLCKPCNSSTARRMTRHESAYRASAHLRTADVARQSSILLQWSLCDRQCTCCTHCSHLIFPRKAPLDARAHLQCDSSISRSGVCRLFEIGQSSEAAQGREHCA